MVIGVCLRLERNSGKGRFALQEFYWEMLLGTDLQVSDGLRIGQRKKLNFDECTRGFDQFHEKP